MSGGHSPYNYAFNNPVLLNDPNGDYPREVQIWREQNGGGPAYDYDIDSFGGGGGSWSPAYSGYNGPGTGNHWADGISNSDWTPNGGSATFRGGLAAGMIVLGGRLYAMTSEGLVEAQEDGRGYWINDNYIDENGEAITHATYIPAEAEQDGSEYGWDDFFKDGKTGATVVRGLASARNVMEKEYVAQATINNAIRGSTASVPNSLRAISTVSKVVGVGGILASWGIAGYQVVNGTDNTSTWVNAGVNTLIIGAAILGGPITVGIAAGVGIVYGVSYLVYGDEMDASINDNFGYR